MCQALDARSLSKTEFNSHLRYTPFLDNIWVKPQEANLESLKVPLREILEHHRNAIPHYRRGEKVTLENISWFSHSIACLYSDIALLLHECLGHEFLDKNENSKDFWNTITSEINEVCQDYALLFHVFLDWKHGPKPQQETKVDWHIRPPCGLRYKTEFKELFEEERDKRFNKKAFDKDSKHSKRNISSHAKKNDETRKGRRQSSYCDKRETNKHQVSEAQLKVAHDECLKAIETMKKNKRIPEIPLSAQNSFIRRKQHSLITEAGFYTDSRGEGIHRHVCILRKAVERESS